MKIYINRKPYYGCWGGGAKFVNSFYDHKFNDFELIPADNTATRPNVILLAGITNDGSGISAEQAIMFKTFHSPDTKIVLRVNENDARKNTGVVDRALIELSKHVDATVFVSQWLSDYFKPSWKCDKTTIIYNGVNKEIFKPSEKLNNGKTNIVMAHWSDNYLKGQDYVEWLDTFVKDNPNYTFTFIGRTNANLKYSTLIKPLKEQALGKELSKYDVCINATRFDPGPNSVIEPISCGLPTYVHNDGGGAVEFAGDDHIFSSTDELKSLLLTNQFENNNISFSPWSDMIEKYVDFIKSLV